MAMSATEAVTAAVPPVAALRIAPHTAPDSAKPSRPTLSVVIVNFCQWNNTNRLTDQLRDSRTAETGTAEIVIIDNHSPSHPILDELRREEGVSLRRFSRNRGFARAVNEGCRLARGDWVFLLNPDMSAPPGFLDRVEEVIREVESVEPRAGVIGFQLRHGDGSRQASCGRFPSLARTLTGLIRPRSRRRCNHVSAESRIRVPWVTGCCLLVRRECLDELNGFDENFFLYYEDVDFCRRANELGWSVWFEPSLTVIHHSPLHTRRVPPGLRLITRHALLTYAFKHWPGWQAKSLAGVISLESRLRGWLARRRGDGEAAEVNGELRNLVRELRSGKERTARRRLRRAASRMNLGAGE